MGMMEKNPAYQKEESESSFENALKQANALPIAPIVDRESDKPAPEAAPAPKQDEPVKADAEINLDFGDLDDETPAMPETLPELISEPELIEEAEEEVEPETEPEVEPEVEPEIEAEPEIEEEPEIEPEIEPEVESEVEPEPETEAVYTDAEQADELMTDEEAALSVELIDETPGKTRSGKVHAINLDTICDHFENGDVVTLDSLKEKRLAPQNAGRLKVLARGTMNKSLTIESDSFSIQAVKMITLAGGHAEQYK
jgi:ribosomal protein L15